MLLTCQLLCGTGIPLSLLGTCVGALQTLREVKQPQTWTSIGNFRSSLHVSKQFACIEGEAGDCPFIQACLQVFKQHLICTV